MLISIKNLLIFIERNSVGCHEIKKITYFLRLFKIQLWPISLIGGSSSGIFRLIALFFRFLRQLTKREIMKMEGTFCLYPTEQDLKKLDFVFR